MSAIIAKIAQEVGVPIIDQEVALQIIKELEVSLISMQEPYLGWVIKTEEMYFNIIDKCPEMKFRKVQNESFPFSVT